MKEKQELQYLNSLLLDKPLFLSIAHLLSKSKSGMTATELADELHLSVPTLYRSTLEMFNLNLLHRTRKGKRILFTLPIKVSEYISKNKSTRDDSRIDHLSITKSIVEKYDLPINSRFTDNMVISIIKEKVKENLPPKIRVRHRSPLRTLLNESIKFDLYLGNENKIFALDLKIIETSRSLHERIGNIILLDDSENFSISKIILAYVLLPISGKNTFADGAKLTVLLDKLNSLNEKIAFLFIISNKREILDREFLNCFSCEITKILGAN